MSAPAQLDPNEVIDPRLSAFWAADPSVLAEPDPLLPPTPNGPGPAQRSSRAATEIGAAFLLVAGLIRARLERSDPPADPAGAARAAWARHAPLWLRLAVPAILHAYRQGLATEALTPAELSALAEDYAHTLGDYLDHSSADALAQGMQAQLAQRWNERLAWQRAAAGYGLEGPSMRAHIAGLLRMSEAERAEIVPASARALVDRLLLARADRLGRAESHSAEQAGQVISWLYAQRSGALPAGCTKRWRTAHNESVCAICAPMDGQRVGLEERFRTPGGIALWAPGAHPNCYCVPELILPDGGLAKAEGGDRWNRNARGEFAHTEGRRRRPTAPPKPADPAVEAILRRLREEPVTEEGDPFAPTAADPFAPVAVDPFAATGDPFTPPAAPDPFAPDPFAPTAAADPFARPGAADPFVPKASADPFAPRARPGRRITRHLIILPSFEPRPEAQHPPYYLPTQWLIDQMRAQNREGQFRNAIQDYERAEVGDVVDFGQHLREVQHMRVARENMLRAEGREIYDRFQHLLGGLPSPQVASRHPHFEHLVEDDDADADGDWAWFWSEHEELLREVRGHVAQYPGEALAELDEPGLRTIFAMAGVDRSGVGTDASREALEDVVRAVPGSSLAQAFFDLVAYGDPAIAGAGAGERLARAMDRELGEDGRLLVPEVYVFDQGFAPGDGRDPESPEVVGRYRVDAVAYHSAFGRPHSTPGVAGYRLVHLTPLGRSQTARPYYDPQPPG